MKKVLLSFFSIFLMGCLKDNSSIDACDSTTYTGKLVLQGICMNYVIEVVSGNLSESLYEKTWTNPMSGEIYNNVFRLGSVCSFPESIQEGDTFTFALNGNIRGSCAVCEAYSPTPSKELSIRVCE